MSTPRAACSGMIEPLQLRLILILLFPLHPSNDTKIGLPVAASQSSPLASAFGIECHGTMFSQRQCTRAQIENASAANPLRVVYALKHGSGNVSWRICEVPRGGGGGCENGLILTRGDGILGHGNASSLGAFCRKTSISLIT